jgi:alpha-ketoglutarate-dependent 2,4-dichlorophenoxyacetate dioxygenase
MEVPIYPLAGEFAAEIGDVDLRSEPAPEILEAIRAAFARYAVLVFPQQQLDSQQHLAFASHFGPLERTVDMAMKRSQGRVDQKLADLANIDANGAVWQADSRRRAFERGNRLWHTDSSFNSPSGYMSMLYARSIPPVGGNTEYTDLRAAWDTLPAPLQSRVRGLWADHSILHSRRKIGIQEFTPEEAEAFAPVRRPLVRVIPESGRTSLYLAAHIGRIEGLSEEESSDLFETLTSHATLPQF